MVSIGQQMMAGERDPTQVGKALGSLNRRCTYLQLNVEGCVSPRSPSAPICLQTWDRSQFSLVLGKLSRDRLK